MYIGHIIEDMGRHKNLGCGPGHYFRALEGQHMSGVDVVLHQLIPGINENKNTGYVSYLEMDERLNHYVLAKLASSAAHIEPKKKGRAMCEIFGAFGWAEDTEFMKFLADHFLVRGINYYVPHAFSPKENDTDCPPNFYNSGKNPQYKYFRLIMEYMNRMCELTQGAVHVPTCAVIYDAEASWVTKDYCDNKDICKVLYDAQLDYDIFPLDSLDSISDDGHVNGEYYPVIILPYSAYYNKDVLEKLKRLSACIICVGEKQIDGFTNVALSELVSYMEKYRDISVSDECRFLRYAHYSRGDEQMYFLSNEDVKAYSTTVTLNGFTGGRYTVYDAFENKAVTRESNDGKISLTLAPNNLVVLFVNSDFCGGDGFLHSEYVCGEVRELCPTWEIEVCRERDLPSYRHYRTADTLDNITGPDGLCDFTGNMRYKAKVQLEKSARMMLDLGAVGQTAEVKLNGKAVGVRIYAPYRFDITDFVCDGENELEIVVANTCVFEQRKDDVFSKYMLIKPSGLLGPVRTVTMP